MDTVRRISLVVIIGKKVLWRVSATKTAEKINNSCENVFSFLSFLGRRARTKMIDDREKNHSKGLG